MSIENQEKYNIDTGRKAICFGKLTKAFYDWLQDFERREKEEFLSEDAIKNQLITQEINEGIKLVIDEEANKESVNLNKEKLSLNYFLKGKTNKEVEIERIEKIKKNYEKEQKLKEIERIRKNYENAKRKKKRKREKAKEKAIKRKVCEITEEINIYELEKMLEDLKKALSWNWMSDKEILEWFKEKVGQEKLEQQQQWHNQYKLEKGKDFMTLKNKLRIDYVQFKNRKLKEDNRKRKLKEAEELTPIPEAIKKYKLETGKNPLTLKDTIRKDYLKWIKENE